MLSSCKRRKPPHGRRSILAFLGRRIKSSLTSASDNVGLFKFKTFSNESSQKSSVIPEHNESEHSKTCVGTWNPRILEKTL